LVTGRAAVNRSVVTSKVFFDRGRPSLLLKTETRVSCTRVVAAEDRTQRHFPVEDFRTAAPELDDDRAMSYGYTQVPPRRADFVTTIVLLVTHGVLVLMTLVLLAGMVVNYENVQDRCRMHNLDCAHAPWLAAWIALGGTAVLFTPSLVLGIHRMMKRRSSFVVPLLGCIGQIIVIVASLAVRPLRLLRSLGER
jgi:hypothetical protein